MDKQLKILYFANFLNKGSNFVEEDIKSALEKLGHEVIAVHEKDYKKLQNIKADIFLFHKAGVGRYISLQEFIILLNHITCKKVMWFFDPVKLFQQREIDIETITQYIDYGFLVDDTWRRRHKFKNLYSLKEGIGTVYKGVVRDELKCDVAFAGSLYGEREEFVATLKQHFGNKFKVFDNLFGQDMADLCASAKIIVAPDFPTNEFYWSSRIYLTLGLGGFLVHPDVYGLKPELIEGTHFAGYKGIDELIMTIEYFLENEDQRKQIQEQGQKKCLETCTFEDRLEIMLEVINNKE
ncbi:MAG: glycosyltransferase [Candidatus Paceibacterota bacterium]|jgi:hypothetical protein